MVSDITSGVRVYLEYSGLTPVYIRFFTAEFYSEIALMVAVKLLQLNLKKFDDYLNEKSYMENRQSSGLTFIIHYEITEVYFYRAF